MRDLFDELEKLGFDRKETMERFLGDKEFYLECLKEAVEDNGFEKLGEELKKQDVMAAFECAHMLKGVITNMGLTELFQKLSLIVEPLRLGNCENLEEVYEEILKERQKYRNLIKEFCD